ncbi:MAG: 3-oxoacyl-ACP synthase [Bacteroidetes bacterium]|nr:3-oxoacyl-ACP synthase [Bacteroidota bacterium]
MILTEISKYCIIRKNTLVLNGVELLSDETNLPFSDFIKTIYKSQEINYPKFFKMDSLSKLAFVASEILLKNTAISENYNTDEIGVIIENRASSLSTDLKYQKSFEDKTNYFPNPSLFVYTLPNIMIGEICIKNNFKGENGLFVFEKFDPQFIEDYVSMLFKIGRINACITGWVDFDDLAKEEPIFEAALFLIEKQRNNEVSANSIIFDNQNLNNIYFNKK